MKSRAFWSVVVVCVFLPGTGRAQPDALASPPYGPRVAPPWNYPAPYGGPFISAGPASYYGGFGYGGFGYGGFGYGGFGYPGFISYSGRAGSFWSNGLSLYGPPVPVSGPVPGVFGNDDLVRQWRSTLAPGYGTYGVGIYATWPRTRFVSAPAWPEPVGPAPVARVAADKAGGCLMISVRVPQPAAEVFVNGSRTAQSGTDRIFVTPPLETGKDYKYTVTARWIERGQVVEMSKEMTGTPGEVVRVDFGR